MKTGRAPACRIPLALAVNVKETVMTSSPGPIPAASSARWIAVVPELTATACLAPMNSAKRASNSSTRAPCAS
jgi:hypothetical protein